MKLIKTALAAATIVLAALTVAVAQSNDAANTYATLKTFDGYWVGSATTDCPKCNFDTPKFYLRIRVTSSGNAIIHEMGGPAQGLGPDHMGDVTVFYLEDGNVLGTHYCDADSRSHLKAVPSAEPGTLAFELVDVTGSTKFGYVSGITFKALSPDHHVEVLTFVFGNKQVMHATLDMQRVKT